MNIQKSIKKRVIVAIYYILPFFILYAISTAFFSEAYLFEWTSRNWYLFLWLPVAISAYYKKYALAASLDIGNIAGVLLGQFLGDHLLSQNIATITQTMSAEQIAQLQLHPGFQIWILTIAFSLVLGVLMTLMTKKQK